MSKSKYLEIEQFFRSLNLYCLEDVLHYIESNENKNFDTELLRNSIDDSIQGVTHISLIGTLIERRKLKNSVKGMSQKIQESTESIETCRSYLNELGKFSPKLLLEYISLIVNEHEQLPFVTYFNVSTGNYESMNQMLRTYMANFVTNNPNDFFRNYCSDQWIEYHLLLPEALEGNWRTEPQPYLCFPKGKKVSVLDFEQGGILSSKLSAFPYLEEEMKKLVNYRMIHSELSQKEVLQQMIDEKQNSQKVYRKDPII